MTGYLGEHKIQFKKLPFESKEFNMQNQNLYNDLYFNNINSNSNFLSHKYSNDLLRKLTIYFNDSWIINSIILQKKWEENQYYLISNYVGI